MSKVTKAGRLAMRREGNIWTSYYVPDGKEVHEGTYLCSISIPIIEACDEKIDTDDEDLVSLRTMFQALTLQMFERHAKLLYGDDVLLGSCIVASEVEKGGNA